MKICRASALCCLGVALGTTAAMAQPLPSLHVHPVDIGRDGSGIVFAEPDGAVVEDGTPRQLDDTTAAGLFAYEVDLSSLSWVEDCQCLRHYVFYVRPRGGAVTTRFKVKGKPTGRYPDHWENVAFDVELDGRGDTGIVRLPVQAQQADGDELVQVHPDAVHAISLHGQRHLWFELRNALTDTPLDVSLPPIVRADDDTLLSVWAADSTSTRRIDPGRTALVDVVVRPTSTLAAARASLRPSLPTTPHAQVTAEFRYVNPEVQGRDESLTAIGRVRFAPDPVVLFLTLVAGVLLGCLVTFLVPKLAPKRTGRWRAFAIALALGSVLELVGMFLVANDSRFVLFGFDLDPWQTLPTALVGIGVGVMGLRAAELLPFVSSKANP